MKNFITILLLLLSSVVISQKTVVITTTVKNKGVVEYSKTDSTTVSPEVLTITVTKDSLVYRDTCQPAPVQNKPPVADAGKDISITLPTNSVSLVGAGTDSDGKISGYVWTKVSGPTVFNIANNTSQTATLSNLVAGVYTFKLTVIDDKGDIGSDEVNITVFSPTTSYGTLIYSSGYNTVNDLDPYGNGQWGSGTLASHLSTTIYKDAPASFKSVPANVSAGIRSEVQYPSSLTPAEGAIEYDVRYETIFQNSGHSLQFHPNTSGGSASPGLWHENGKFVWVNWKGGTNTKYPTNFTIPQNRWMHIVFEYKMGSSGYMKFTIDGVVVLNASNIQVGDGSGSFLKVGVNMWVDQSSVVYYDNLKIWKKTNTTAFLSGYEGPDNATLTTPSRSTLILTGYPIRLVDTSTVQIDFTRLGTAESQVPMTFSAPNFSGCLVFPKLLQGK